MQAFLNHRKAFYFSGKGIFGRMKRLLFRLLARLNRWLLPSFSKNRLDLAKAKKWQLALIGWRYYVTRRALD